MAYVAKRQGFGSLTDYLRHLDAHAEREAPARQSVAFPADGVRVYHATERGTVLCGDALCHLHNAETEGAPPRASCPAANLAARERSPR